MGTYWITSNKSWHKYTLLQLIIPEKTIVSNFNSLCKTVYMRAEGAPAQVHRAASAHKPPRKATVFLTLHSK
jgi:hypothetical protein